MGRRGWGQKEWIDNYWLRRMKEPFEEQYSIRQAFYKELPEIVRLVPDRVKTQTKDWAMNFYRSMCAYLSDLVLEGQVRYRTINVYDDSGATTLIWQDYQFVEMHNPEDAWVEYPIEVWVENNATYNSCKRLFDGEERRFQINLLSQRGFANTQQLEAMLLDRKQDVKVILNLTDFDPSGYCMPQDLENRCKQIGLDVTVLHIGILPGQIPDERKVASLVTYKKSDPRCKKFREKFHDDPMVMTYHGYEIQALAPTEIRQLIVNRHPFIKFKIFALRL